MQASDRADVVNRQSSGGSLRGYTPFQTLYLLRLQSLITKKQQAAGRMEPRDWRLKLLDKALYSTYRSCVDLNIADEARNLLRQLRQARAS